MCIIKWQVMRMMRLQGVIVPAPESKPKWEIRVGGIAVSVNVNVMPPPSTLQPAGFSSSACCPFAMITSCTSISAAQNLCHCVHTNQDEAYVTISGREGAGAQCPAGELHVIYPPKNPPHKKAPHSNTGIKRPAKKSLYESYDGSKSKNHWGVISSPEMMIYEGLHIQYHPLGYASE